MLKTSVNNFFISTIKKKKYKHNKYWDVEIVQKYLRNIAIQTFFQYAKTLLGFIYMCNTSWNKMVTNGIKLVKLKYPVLPFSSEQRLVTVIYRNIVVCNSTSAIFCHILSVVFYNLVYSINIFIHAIYENEFMTISISSPNMPFKNIQNFYYSCFWNFRMGYKNIILKSSHWSRPILAWNFHLPY